MRWEKGFRENPYRTPQDPGGSPPHPGGCGCILMIVVICLIIYVLQPFFDSTEREKRLEADRK